MKAFQFNTLALLLSLSIVSTFPVAHAKDAPAKNTSKDQDLDIGSILNAPGKKAPATPPAAATPSTPPPAVYSTTPAEKTAEPAQKTSAPAKPRPAKKHHHTEGITRQDINERAPQQYTVVKGDTLWAISGRFLKKPWRWHELWQMNRNEIKDPHWIYPGDILVLEFDSNGRAHLRKAGQRYATNYVGRLTPRARVEPLNKDAIPTISPAEIAPFLSKPLVINAGELDSTPKIVGSLDERVVLGQGDIVYVKGLPNDGADDQIWQIYRPGRALVQHKLDEKGDPADVILGYEAVHLGDAKVRKQSEEIGSIEIIRAKQEIARGDRLVPAPKTAPMNYVPRAPEAEVNAEIIALPEGVAETGRNNIVAISAGSSEGLEIGHVLAIHKRGRLVKLPDDNDNEIKLPDERIGLLMVFRVFEHVSYGLVMGSERQIQIGDRLLLP